MARPSEYKKEYIDKVDDYLSQYEKLGDATPTKEGFAIFIGTTKPAIYRWAEKHKGFRYALERIESQQGRDLQNKGLTGEFNSPITKLMLSANHDMREKSDVDVKSGGKVVSSFNFITPNGENNPDN